MAADGKDLEEIVAFVERTMVPDGCTVEVRKKLFLESGVQEAEFDVEVRGKLGSADVAVLIECRDRPSQGAANASWIYELHGKKESHRFNKVIAVSTTGFAEPAIKQAGKLDVELRTLDKLDAGAFEDWLQIDHFDSLRRATHLKSARFLIDENSPEEKQQALRAVLKKANSNTPLLKSTKSRARNPAVNAFLGIVEQKELFSKVEPGAAGLPVAIVADYPNDDDHFVIETPAGDVRVRAIEFEGELRIEKTSAPLERLLLYRDQNGRTISQVAIFAAQLVMGVMVRIEFHRIPDSGHTHVLMRTEPQKKVR